MSAPSPPPPPTQRFILAALLLILLYNLGIALNVRGSGPAAPAQSSLVAVGDAFAAPTTSAALAAPACDPLTPSFLDVCLDFRSDKCGTHSYHHAYTRALAHLRCRAGGGRLLEIGIGCNMYIDAPGPARLSKLHEGRSLALWLSYFPAPWLVTTLEFDGQCIANFKAEDPLTPLLGKGAWARTTLFVGSQSDPVALHDVEKLSGPFDVVVDDGGHSMRMQIVSLFTLFPLLVPGGVYIIEDIGSSGMWAEGPGPHAMFNDYEVTAMAYVQHLASLVAEVPAQLPRQTGPTGAPLGGPAQLEHIKELANMTASVECYTQLCVLRKCPEGKFGASCG